MSKLLLPLTLIFFTGNFLAQSEQESLEILLDKLNKLEQEISNLSNNLDQNTYELQRIEDANQLRYMDLDKRIHQLETLILLSSEEDNQDQIELSDLDENPLSGLISNDGSEEEFSLWSNSLKLIENSRYSEAAENLRLLIISFPQGEYSVEAYFYLGDIYFQQQMYQDSIETFNSLLNNFPENKRTPESFFKLGLNFLQLEDETSARSNFNKVIQNYPESSAAILSEEELVKLNN
ncbi:MAG: tetratricopeptide repeat protein [Gammaproteobacteria bacterium]